MIKQLLIGFYICSIYIFSGYHYLLADNDLKIYNYNFLNYNTQSRLPVINFNKAIDFKYIKKISVSPSYTYKHITPNVVINGDFAYTVDSNNFIITIDLERKKVVNRFKLPASSPTLGLAFFEDSLYVSFENGTIIAYSIVDKNVLWSIKLITPVNSAPIVDENKLFLMANNTVYAIDIYTGNVLWNYKGSTAGVSLKTINSLTVYSGYVMVVISSSDVIILRKENGQLLWKENLNNMNLINISANPLVGDIKAPITPINDKVLILANNKTIYMDLHSKTREWQNNDYNTYQAPFIVGNIVYITDVYDNLLSINLKDGSLNWKVKLNTKKDAIGRTYWHSPLKINGELMLSNSSGEVFFMSPKNGKEIRYYALYQNKREKIYHAPYVTSNNMIFISAKGNIYIL